MCACVQFLTKLPNFVLEKCVLCVCVGMCTHAHIHRNWTESAILLHNKQKCEDMGEKIVGGCLFKSKHGEKQNNLNYESPLNSIEARVLWFKPV